MTDSSGDIEQRKGVPAAGGEGDVVTYRFGGAELTVETDDGESARWLREFLTPWFTMTAASAAGLRVQMVSSAERFAELQARQVATGTRPVACFCLDSALVSYPGWSEPDGTRVVADGEYGCYYRVMGSRVEVVVRPQDRVARIGLLRVVRELATLGALAAPDMLDLHAAAFVFQGRAVLLVGGKRAGKTTLLSHVLASGQAALLANDRLLVGCGSSLALGVPTVVPIREETEQRFAVLARGLPRRATLFHTGELQTPEAASLGAGARLVLSPAQFAHQLGATTAGAAPLGAIVFPEISAEESVWSLHPVGRDDGAARLCQGLYAGRSGPREATLFHSLVGEANSAEAQTTLARRLATETPLVRCRLGPDAYRGHARAWLRALPLAKGESPA
jgi:hypothetical protein